MVLGLVTGNGMLEFLPAGLFLVRSKIIFCFMSATLNETLNPLNRGRDLVTFFLPQLQVLLPQIAQYHPSLLKHPVSPSLHKSEQ
jgi:hypothetical protein